MHAGLCETVPSRRVISLHPPQGRWEQRPMRCGAQSGSGCLGRERHGDLIRCNSHRITWERKVQRSFLTGPQQASEHLCRTRRPVIVRAKKAQPEDDTWRRRSLSSLEEELLGIQPSDVKPKRKKVLNPEGEIPGPKRRPDGGEWSMLDEVEEKLGFSLPDLDKYPVVSQLTKIGEWLEERTTVKEEDYGKEPWTGLWIILGIFPLWLFCVFVATGVLHLPPALAPLERWLTTE